MSHKRQLPCWFHSPATNTLLVVDTDTGAVVDVTQQVEAEVPQERSLNYLTLEAEVPVERSNDLTLQDLDPVPNEPKDSDSDVAQLPDENEITDVIVPLQEPVELPAVWTSDYRRRITIEDCKAAGLAGT